MVEGGRFQRFIAVLVVGFQFQLFLQLHSDRKIESFEG